MSFPNNSTASINIFLTHVLLAGPQTPLDANNRPLYSPNMERGRDTWWPLHHSYMKSLLAPVPQKGQHDWLDPADPWHPTLAAAMSRAGRCIKRHEEHYEEASCASELSEVILETARLAPSDQEQQKVVNAMTSELPRFHRLLTESMSASSREYGHRYDNLDTNKLSELFAVDELDDRLSWAHPRQLMFGKIVGDVLHLHAPLASLLSPTGGIVGPSDSPLVLYGVHSMLLPVLKLGAKALHWRSRFSERWADRIMRRHGIAHDAFGYLYTHHNNVGPGYAYITQHPTSLFGLSLGPSNAFADQFDGPTFWNGLDQGVHSFSGNVAHTR